MRFIFKTDYEDDIRLFPHSGYVWSYGVLLVLLAIAPFVLSSYLMSQLVFVCIYATVGVGLLILTGFTGQASLGHAAFLAIGAYTAAYLQQYNVPFPVYFLAAGLLTGIIGALVGFPALRLQGIYLVIATISFAFIVEEILARWESVTNGNEGMRVKTLSLFGASVPRDSPAFYFLCLGFLILTIVGTLNLLRSPTGRAFIAIRDSETAARSMGINVALYKVKSFAISAAITGFAGCLFAHKLSFISPEMFTLQLSIEFIIVILIGGTFSLHGAVLGAIFVVMIDPFLTYLKDDMPGMVAGLVAALGAGSERAAHIQDSVAAFASANGLKGAIYGIIIILFVLFEPLGLYGRWLKIKLFENATVLNNLLVGRHRHSTTRLWQELLFLPSVRRNEKEHRRRVEQVIEFLDLEPYRDKLISGLPYGVRKVIELARALCSEPKLILLDEPSSGLNVEETDDMSFWIRDMKTELGVTVLMVEHRSEGHTSE